MPYKDEIQRKERRRKYYQLNKEKMRQQDKAKRQRNHAAYLASAQAWRDANREKIRMQNREWRRRNPEKVKLILERNKQNNLAYKHKKFAMRTVIDRLIANAQDKLQQAVKDGILIRPDKCEKCQLLCKPYGHHDDYLKPLEVRWLCISCHKIFHNEQSRIDMGVIGLAKENRGEIMGCYYCDEPFKECDTIVVKNDKNQLFIGPTDKKKYKGHYYHAGCIEDSLKGQACQKSQNK